MRVKVEQCWNGNQLFFLLSLPNYSRERVYSDVWDRKTATICLDLIENLYKVKRANVRFIHK